LYQEKNQTTAFLERGATRVKALNDRNWVEICFRTCYMAVIALGMIVILGFGGYEVLAGILTIGGLVAFYSYLGRLFDPLNAAVDIYSRFKRLSTSVRRIVGARSSVKRKGTVRSSPRFPSPCSALEKTPKMNGYRRPSGIA
jgi:ABC-type bacteriocin/lantibiotic exporter with double-glycine peptidase domain